MVSKIHWVVYKIILILGGLVPSQLPVQNIVQEIDPIIMNQHQDILLKRIAESGLPYEPSTLTRSVIMIVISVHPTVLLAS